MESSLFGARLFYVVFHSLGLIVLCKYDSPIREEWLRGSGYYENCLTYLLMGASFYFFLNCGKNPGIAPTQHEQPPNKPRSFDEEANEVQSLSPNEGSSNRPSFEDNKNEQITKPFNPDASNQEHNMDVELVELNQSS